MMMIKISNPLLFLALILSFSLFPNRPPFASSAKDHQKLLSLSPNSDRDDLLVSPNRIFSAGFFPVGDNAFTFSVWFLDPSCHHRDNRNDGCTVVWTANRDIPVNGRNSELALLPSGNLVLTDAGRTVVWESKTSSPSSSSPRLILLDSGNLVVANSNGATILWQSFDFPTDTLLPNQPLTKEAQLVSARSLTNRSSGFFKLYFDNDNVLRLLYSDPVVSSVYWPDPELMSWEAGRSTYNSSRTASLDSLGRFNSTDGYSFMSADYGLDLQRRITLDFDGNVRLYSRRRPNSSGEESWKITWEAMSQSCRIHGSCGPNSLCNYVPGIGRKCSCIPGFRAVDGTDWSLGCKREFDLPCKPSNETEYNETEFLKLPNVEFYGYDFAFVPNCTFEKCMNVCLKRCDCMGFQFKFIKHDHPSNIPYCFAKTMLLNGRRSSDFQGDMYLKVPRGSGSGKFKLSYEPLESFHLNCPAGVAKQQLDRTYTSNKENGSLKFVLCFAVAIGLIEFIGISLVWYYLNSRSRQGYSTMEDDNQFRGGSLFNAFGFRRFTYAELKKATRKFKDEIGRGAGGVVYRGTLADGRVAAIKKMNGADQAEEEFQSEVSTVGKLNHMNLIEMWGYCAEGNHRLLVYEYADHGSLAANLKSGSLDWETRFRIAVGTAKGLAYLHEECLEWVLHCDVKPENILIGKEFQAKVSDFGLAQAVKREGGEVTRRARGTRGYMAPEWVLNHVITSKVDVFSYGIVVLEMVTGKSPAVTAAEEEEVEVVKWVREKVKDGEDWLEKVVDPKLAGGGGRRYVRREAEVSVAVALRCVAEDKDSRPTMRQVVELLLHHPENSPTTSDDTVTPDSFG